MRLARALELTHNIASTPNSIEGLDALLDPSLVEQALEQAGVATLRKRRLPFESMLWCIPKYLAELHASALHYVLPHRREERVYPRAIRLKSSKYPIRKKNASQLN